MEALKVFHAIVLRVLRLAAPAISIRGMVGLAPAIAACPGDTVFETGSPMPIAAWRSRLPLTFTLDQTTLLSPVRTLEDVDTLVVGARISKRQGHAHACDWEATPSTVRRDTKSRVALVTDHKVM